MFAKEGGQKVRTVNQSINQPINQSIDRSINQSIKAVKKKQTNKKQAYFQNNKNNDEMHRHQTNFSFYEPKTNQLGIVKREKKSLNNQ